MYINTVVEKGKRLLLFLKQVPISKCRLSLSEKNADGKLISN